MVPFWGGAPPILLCFSGNWDVHRGYGISTHGRIARQEQVSTRWHGRLEIQVNHDPTLYQVLGGPSRFKYLVRKYVDPSTAVGLRLPGSSGRVSCGFAGRDSTLCLRLWRRLMHVLTYLEDQGIFDRHSRFAAYFGRLSRESGKPNATAGP